MFDGIALVGLTGYAGSGKDTVADMLVRKYGFRRYAFADSLKDVALSINPYVEPGREYRLADALHFYGGWQGAKTVPEVRRFLQELGTSMRDIIDPSIWIKFVMNKVANTQCPVVITDVRFKNEVTAIRKFNGKLVRIIRPDVGLSGMLGTHLSETELTTTQTDYTLSNDGTLVDLAAAVDRMMLLGVTR